MGNSAKKDIEDEWIRKINGTTWAILYVDLNERYQYQ